MPGTSLRFQIARILLWAALVFLLAAQPQPWSEELPTWKACGDFLREIPDGIRGGYLPGGGFRSPHAYSALLAAIVAVLFLCPVCPWFVRVLAGNAALRWICRVLSVAAYLGLMSGWTPSLDRWMDGRAPFSGCALLALASFLNAAGLCLLPGRKIPPLNYDASSSR